MARSDVQQVAAMCGELIENCCIFEPAGALNPALPIVLVAEKKTELEPTVAERVGTPLEKPFSLPALIQAIHLLLGQPAPPWRARQETATKQTYETESATGGRRQ